MSIELHEENDSNQDTYDLQRDLMERSGQDLPTQVCITPQAIMYFALNMEELGETATAMADAIHAGKPGPTNVDQFVSNANGFSHAADDLAAQGAMLKQYARGMRECVRSNFGTEQPRLVISLDHAVEIVDGCVDVAVVNAGLTLSIGAPGRQCYDDVVLSNLSKVNPETGVIDKEPDGKWIKGANYRKPNLAVILEPLLLKAE